MASSPDGRISYFSWQSSHSLQCFAWSKVTGPLDFAAFRTMGLFGGTANPFPAANTIATTNAVQNPAFLTRYPPPGLNGENHKFEFQDNQGKPRSMGTFSVTFRY